jgi:transcriptional antiterminator
MTRKELCERYNISEQTVQNQFGRAKKTMLNKYNLILIKEGRGVDTDYKVEPNTSNSKRALTMTQEEKREVMMVEKGFSNLLDFNFMVFLAICTTPMGTFYGSYEDFLDYVQVKKTKINITNLKDALIDLSAGEYIEYIVDKTNENYFNAFLFKRTRDEMAISLDMVERCQKLANENNKRSWVPLLKTWIGIQYMYDKQPFTMRQLCDLTGLSAYQIRESKKILEEDSLFVTSKAYLNYTTCIGTEVKLIPFNESNRKVIKRSQNS